MNYLLVKFHGYSRKIVEAKKHWKLDLAGSYGSSGSAFEGEDLSMGDDFFIGAQLSRPFGLHSLTSSLTHQKTSPKLGQSDRTESTAASTELGLFNQYGGIAEEKEAARNQTGNLSTITNTTLKMVFIAMVTMLIKKGVFVSKKA